mmetsp:Transcript_43296/g.104896  ORF Transcript_43296/g.104896 Transcript_43296/m.104896 type:complete len:108 (-) Transcript_43296:1554-1877(-)
MSSRSHPNKYVLLCKQSRFLPPITPPEALALLVLLAVSRRRNSIRWSSTVHDELLLLLLHHRISISPSMIRTPNIVGRRRQVEKQDFQSNKVHKTESKANKRKAIYW